MVILRQHPLQDEHVARGPRALVDGIGDELLGDGVHRCLDRQPRAFVPRASGTQAGDLLATGGVTRHGPHGSHQVVLRRWPHDLVPGEGADLCGADLHQIPDDADGAGVELLRCRVDGLHDLLGGVVGEGHERVEFGFVESVGVLDQGVELVQRYLGQLPLEWRTDVVDERVARDGVDAGDVVERAAAAEGLDDLAGGGGLLLGDGFVVGQLVLRDESPCLLVEFPEQGLDRHLARFRYAGDLDHEFAEAEAGDVSTDFAAALLVGDLDGPGGEGVDGLGGLRRLDGAALTGRTGGGLGGSLCLRRGLLGGRRFGVSGGGVDAVFGFEGVRQDLGRCLGSGVGLLALLGLRLERGGFGHGFLGGGDGTTIPGVAALRPRGELISAQFGVPVVHREHDGVGSELHVEATGRGFSYGADDALEGFLVGCGAGVATDCHAPPIELVR